MTSLSVALSICEHDLRQIFEEINHLVYNASSMKIPVPIDDYISFVTRGEIVKNDLHIEGKRITADKVMQIIRGATVNSYVRDAVKNSVQKKELKDLVRKACSENKLAEDSKACKYVEKDVD
jgi:hypothetical protein